MGEVYFVEPGFAQNFAKETPMGRLAAPADVAETVLWLASEQAFATGEHLQVNGGASLRRLPTAAEITGT